MPPWLFGLAITLLVGAAATAYLWLIRRRDDETAAGLLALAGMRWRDFSRLVLEAMQLRGMDRVPSAGEDLQEHGSSFLLAGQGKQLLLSCKHGSAYRIGTAAVDELASEVRLRGAQGAVLVTQGVIDRDGVQKAGKDSIEIIDGPLLWPLVKPLVEGGLRRRICGTASARAGRHIGIAWLGSVTLGLGSALVLANMPTRNPEPLASAPVAAPGTPSVPATDVAATRLKPAQPIPSSSTPVPDAPEVTEADTEKHRAEVSRKMANVPGISRGIWISRSTLSVDRAVAEQEAWPLVCAQLKAYPDLALTRVQMNPPQGSSEPVRWRQCEAF